MTPLAFTLRRKKQSSDSLVHLLIAGRGERPSQIKVDIRGWLRSKFMRGLLAFALVATAVLIGVATFLGSTGTRRDCPPPSGRSVEDLFAPCMAQKQREEIETTGRR